MDNVSIFVLVILALGIVTVWMGVKSVPQGYEWPVERFGRYQRTLEPGLNLIVPYIDQVRKKLCRRRPRRRARRSRGPLV